ncbi:unnamed protein product [Caenorhabditis angaria]|uniref:Uncharacterized protein n=1 Tax=Caenorhabditis angaria TaxID=860376 RepID=A0A9P1MXS5_9PELO|nr:unnamed protein product [Caenorhabditis angaria]
MEKETNLKNIVENIIGYELFAVYHNDQLHNPLLIIALTRRRNIPFDILEQSRINYYLKNPVKVCVIWNTMSRDIPTFTDQDDDDYSDFQTYRDQLNTMEISPIFKALIDGKVVRKECYEFIFSSGIESYRYREKFMKSIEKTIQSKTTAKQLKSLFSDFKKSQK